LTNILFHLCECCLGSGKIACAKHNKLAIVTQFEGKHFTIGANLIDARIGSGVRTENNASTDGNCATICHNRLIYMSIYGVQDGLVRA